MTKIRKYIGATVICLIGAVAIVVFTDKVSGTTQEYIACTPVSTGIKLNSSTMGLGKDSMVSCDVDQETATVTVIAL